MCKIQENRSRTCLFFPHRRERVRPAAGGFLQVHGLVVLVHDLAAEDFFQYVFQAHDARDGAPLVHDAHHVAALLEEAEQELVERQAVGYQEQGPHHLAEQILTKPKQHGGTKQ